MKKMSASKTSKNELINKANQGNSDSQLELGLCYAYCDNGFDRDQKEAVFWLKKAADSGNLDAMMNLINLVRTGRSADWLDIKGNDFIKWLKKAAKEAKNQSHKSLAMVILGSIYLGDDENNYIWRFQEFTSLNDPPKGLRLIEEGIAIAEGLGENNMLKYIDYYEIWNAYHADTRKPVNRLGDSYIYNKMGTVKGLERKYYSADKALVLAKKGNAHPQYISAYEMALESTIEELRAAREIDRIMK